MKRNREDRELGQGLVEYALILNMVAIVVIAVLMLLGPVIGYSLNEAERGLEKVAGSELARESLQEFREATEEKDEHYAEAFDGLMEIVEEAVEFLQESGAGDTAVQVAAFLEAIRTGNLVTASTIADNLNLTSISPTRWEMFFERQGYRLAKSCESLASAAVTDEFNTAYNEALLFSEETGNHEAIEYLKQARFLIDLREGERLNLVESGPLAALCQ